MKNEKYFLQCCYGGEVPKGIVLRHIYEELETCFKSLASYLDSKRRQFPRFYMVSDAVLLGILSRPDDLESVRPYLRLVYTQTLNILASYLKLDASSDYICFCILTDVCSVQSLM